LDSVGITIYGVFMALFGPLWGNQFLLNFKSESIDFIVLVCFAYEYREF